MRLILRIMGTWLLGMAMIMAIIDGTRSLAANAVLMTPTNGFWADWSPESLDWMHSLLAAQPLLSSLDQAFTALLQAPGFMVVGAMGIGLALLGRAPRQSASIEQNQI